MKVETISKYFRKAVLLDPKMDVVSCDMEEDPFIDVDESIDLQRPMMQRLLMIAAVHRICEWG